MTVSILQDERINIHDFVSRSEYIGIPRKAGEEIMAYCFTMSSHHWIGKVNEEIACVWGLIPPTILSEQAYLWLVTTELLKDHKFIFIRHSQRQLEEMLKHYPLIVGHCECTNELAQRWIKWLGGTFSEPQGTKLPFQIRRK